MQVELKYIVRLFLLCLVCSVEISCAALALASQLAVELVNCNPEVTSAAAASNLPEVEGNACSVFRLEVTHVTEFDIVGS